MPDKPYVNSNKSKPCLDTNILLPYSKEVFTTLDNIHLFGYILGELDNLKKNGKTEEVKFQARRVTRDIEKYKDKITYIIDETDYSLPSCYDKETMDNKIIALVKELHDKDDSFYCLSNDLLFRAKCKSLDIPCEKFDHIFLSGYVAGEMDNLRKYGKTEETKFQARRACRYIDENEDKITYLIRETDYDLPEDFDKDNMDNKIISILYKMWKNDNTFIAYSNDILFRQKCKDLGIPYSKFGGKDDTSDDSYLGYKEITLSEYELETFYE